MSRRLPTTGATILALIACAVAALFVWNHRRDMPRTASRLLENPDRYELLSLYPYLTFSAQYSAADRFHGHPIIGRTFISDPGVQRKLNDALRVGARESDGSMMACFNPRHGIRVTHGRQVTDFVICFECRQVEVFQDEKQIAFFITTSSPQSMFDQALRSVGVPLADKLR